MSYLVLARKYRPRNFSEMMGQSHVLRALSNALSQQRLHHAYLFTGTRGVGKTTIARILAKCLNCEQGISATPCGQCTACLEIEQGRHVDLLEIDAASRTKVEDTRELLENVQYSPQRGRYKIYLIDEVHMLSAHSFNALLKTLEEPPLHVKFLLATTDLQKLPATILSRCLHFHLKNMSIEQIEEQLATILHKEEVTFEQNALPLIAKAAQGSLRDALSLLDQAIAYSGGEVKSHDISQMLGLINEQKVQEIIQLLAKQQAQALLKKIDELAELGADFLAVLDDILNHFQQMAVAQLLGEPITPYIKPEDIQLYYQIGLLGKRDLPLAPNPKVGFSMALIRMLAFTPTKPLEKNHDLQGPSDLSIHSTASVANPGPEQWASLVPKLNLTGATQLLASNCMLTTWNDGLIALTLDESHIALLNSSTQARLTKALQAHANKPCKVTVSIGKSTAETPAKLQQRLSQAKYQAAQEDILRDPHVQHLMEKFSATLQSDSLVLNER